jgi:biopolymer transport protein ExbB
MIDLMQKGGPLMWLLLAASILMVGVVAERWTYLRRTTISVSDFLSGLSNLIRRGHYAEAQIECKSTPGPVARVVYAAILRPDLSRADLKEIVQEAGQLEVPRLETHLPLLNTIANVAPLVGLLGTVGGMISSFVKISAQGGNVSASALSGGIYQSLLTTAAGLVVAIPAYVAHNYLSTKVNALLHDMERAGIEIVNLLVDHRNIIPFGSGPATPETGAATQVVDFRKQRRE